MNPSPVIGKSTRYIIERMGVFSGAPWQPWGYPGDDEDDAIDGLWFCRENEIGAFRLVRETRETLDPPKPQRSDALHDESDYGAGDCVPTER